MHIIITLGAILYGTFVVWYWTNGPGRGHRIKTTRRGTRGLTWLFGVKNEVVPKKGWWQASDGRWYPPHLRQRRLPPPPT